MLQLGFSQIDGTNAASRKTPGSLRETVALPGRSDGRRLGSVQAGTRRNPLRSSRVQHNSRKKETLEASRTHSLVVHRRARQAKGAWALTMAQWLLCNKGHSL